MTLLMLPVLLPLATAILLLRLRAHPRLEWGASCVSGAALLGITLWLFAATARGDIFILPLGNWPPGVGIVWLVDRMSAIMLLIAAIISLATLIYAPGGLTDERERRPFFYVLHQLLLVGINGTFVTGDFFNLYVFFEVMLLTSFAQISLGARAEQLTKVFPYVIVNLVSSSIQLSGIGLMYGVAGTVNMAAIAERIASDSLPPLFFAALALILVSYALKAALLPLFFWLPDSYPYAPIPVSALFAGLLTKVSVYLLFRVVPLLSGPTPTVFHDLLIFLSAATMLVGVLGALGRNSIRGILSFHIISQVGYMIFGLALYSPVALAAGIFFLIHQIPVKTALFLAGGIVERVGDSGELGVVRGAARSFPWVAVVFFVAMLALAGIPPLSGFFGKLFLIYAGLEEKSYLATAVAILVSFFTLSSMLKIWTKAFWGEPAGQKHPERGRDPRMLLPALTLTLLAVLIGLFAAPLFAYTEATAAQLLDTTSYREAVLGPQSPEEP